jgi:NADPH-dependent curcumin reductase CurA
MLDIDLGKIVTTLGENTIADIGEPLGLSRELSIKAATSLAKNFHGDKDEAIAAAAAETGIGKDVLEAMITKLAEEARVKAMGAVKEQAAAAAKGMFGKFFGR